MRSPSRFAECAAETRIPDVLGIIPAGEVATFVAGLIISHRALVPAAGGTGGCPARLPPSDSHRFAVFSLAANVRHLQRAVFVLTTLELVRRHSKHLL